MANQVYTLREENAENKPRKIEETKLSSAGAKKNEERLCTFI